MVLGVHDTDYFAKARVSHKGAGRFALMPHNDGTTKSLWSAAGEISTLFGSETFPARHDYVKAGVAFRRLARAHPEGPQAFLDEMTEAWGWRGLVYTGSRDLIVHYLPLREVGDGIIDMLRWGFAQRPGAGRAGLLSGRSPRASRKPFWAGVRSSAPANPDKNLSDLFQFVLPRLYEMVLGAAPQNIRVDCTTNLLCLTPETASFTPFSFRRRLSEPRNP